MAGRVLESCQELWEEVDCGDVSVEFASQDECGCAGPTADIRNSETLSRPQSGEGESKAGGLVAPRPLALCVDVEVDEEVELVAHDVIFADFSRSQPPETQVLTQTAGVARGLSPEVPVRDAVSGDRCAAGRQRCVVR